MKLVIGNKRYSSWSFRPWFLMKAAGIPFQEIQAFLRTEAGTKMIRRYSPGGRVPVLLDAKVTVWESLSICEYLAEKFPKKQLWPKNPAERAEARSISNEMHAGFQALRTNLPCHFLARYEDFKIPREAQGDIQRIQEIWIGCRKKYARGGSFLFGKLSVADAMFAPVVFRFLAYKVPVSSIVHQYMKVIESLPATQEWISGAAKETQRIAVYENLARS